MHLVMGGSLLYLFLVGGLHHSHNVLLLLLQVGFVKGLFHDNGISSNEDFLGLHEGDE